MTKQTGLRALFLALAMPCGAHLDLVYAKLEFLAKGKLLLTQTVDYGANPNVPDEKAAVELLQQSLGMDRGKGYESLTAVFGSPKFTHSKELDATTPPAYRFSDEHASQRQFLQASWQLELQASPVFAMPASTPLDVLLWTVPSDGNMANADLFYLLPNERTMAIPLELPGYDPIRDRKSQTHAAWWLMGGLVLGLLLWLVLVPKRRA
jgi:hypothetical protein